MAKYIDADALFNETEHLACYDNRDRDAFEDLILSMPAADVEPVRKWIPCSERLPKVGETVLCYTRFCNPYTVLAYEKLPTDKNATFRPGNYVPGTDVKYWMPLPKMDGGSEE